MPKKTTIKTNRTTGQQTVKFAKGGYYQDLGGDLWFCINAKQKRIGDDSVVMMQATEDGQPVGEAMEQSVGAFSKQLTAAELKEYRAVCQRELEAAGDQGGEPAPTAAKTKSQKAEKATPAAKQPGKMSALDAAAKVLGESKEPMATKAMIDAMSAKGYWTSPGGQTPHATLYAAILREINVKGAESRFAKTDKGRFALAGK